MSEEDPSGGDSLREYRNKRDFGRTGEPTGEPVRGKEGTAPIFVVQKHHARQLHYDLRLEVGGVLKSWAIPKGPPTDPRDRRLAVPTEDHPMEYADFEGRIPEGEYGAGTVIVWDTGTYENLKEQGEEPVPMEECLQHGRVEIRLEGQKLRGGYALIRTGGSSGSKAGRREQWLLIKMKDEAADPRNDLLNTEPRSVLSGKTIEEMAE